MELYVVTASRKETTNPQQHYLHHFDPRDACSHWRPVTVVIFINDIKTAISSHTYDILVNQMLNQALLVTVTPILRFDVDIVQVDVDLH